MSRGNSKFSLHPFQEEVRKAVMNGENVILQAPTGAGKTRAALTPFIDHLAAQIGNPYKHQIRLPLTCRYAVPLRVLASQFYNEFHHISEKVDRHWASSIRKTYELFAQELVQIQTGEQPLDRHFESALTFCTIDQLLASFLAIPYGVGKRRANMNVGGIIGSYLIFDEFHLYPLARNGKSSWGARTSVLQMLTMLNHKNRKLTPFVMMTATFSSQLIKRLSDLLGATVIQVDTEPGKEGAPSELDKLNNDRQRFFTVHDAPMEPRMILGQHNGCSLVVCNTVLRAQQTYLGLRSLLAHEGLTTKLVLLHSRFTDTDRSEKQKLLEVGLGKDAWDGNEYKGEDLIIVATQVVEVGLDVSVRTLHTEAAPANSTIQRAGRCARFGKQEGHVHIYPIPPNDGGQVSYLPYDRIQTEKTREAFSPLSNQHVGFQEEQQVIDAVHSDEDSALLDTFLQEKSLIREKMYNGFAAHDRAIASQLIRNVEQVSVLIHDDPNTAITERPWEWQTFGLSSQSIEVRWQVLLEAAQQSHVFGDDSPIAWRAQAIEADKEENERRPTQYFWEPVTTPNHICQSLILALSPDIATYSSELGLMLRDGRLPVDWPKQPHISQHMGQHQRRFQSFGYDQESYAEHIGGLWNAYLESRLRDDTRFIASRLEQALCLEEGSVDMAIRLAIACHDIGKLGEGWQKWAHAWQVKLTQVFPEHAEYYKIRRAPFAHTDYDPSRHFHIKKEFDRESRLARPHHACESAYLAADLIYQVAKNELLTRVIIAAIARHHNATSLEYQSICLIPEAPRYIEEVFKLVSQRLFWQYDIQELEQHIDTSGKLDNDLMTIPRKEIELEMLLYFVIVRVLRLADGRSFAFK